MKMENKVEMEFFFSPKSFKNLRSQPNSQWFNPKVLPLQTSSSADKNCLEELQNLHYLLSF